VAGKGAVGKLKALKNCREYSQSI